MPGCDWVGGRDYLTVYCRRERSWPQSQFACQAWGGNLVTVLSDQDDTLLARAIANGEADT